jgi:hypothetical protein
MRSRAIVARVFMSVTKSAMYKYLAELTAPVISLSKQLPNDIPLAREKPEETGFFLRKSNNETLN